MADREDITKYRDFIARVAAGGAISPRGQADVQLEDGRFIGVCLDCGAQAGVAFHSDGYVIAVDVERAFHSDGNKDSYVVSRHPLEDEVSSLGRFSSVYGVHECERGEST